MLSIIVPVLNEHDNADEAIDSFRCNAKEKVEVIVVDNGSEKLYRNKHAKVIRNPINVGCLPALLQGTREAAGELVAWFHADIYIHEQGWDKRVKRQFTEHDATMVAFFGSPAIDLNGMRLNTVCNLAGKKWGKPWNGYSLWSDGESDIIAVDSVAMICRANELNKIELSDLPPHHWFDRIFSLRLWDAGLKTRFVGIEFDHKGGAGYYQRDAFEELCREWCEQREIPKIEHSWDLSVADYGKKLFQSDWKKRLPRLMARSKGNIDVRLLRYCWLDGYDIDDTRLLEYNLSKYL